MTEVYVSIDIEADGPIPGKHSMLSLGAAAFTLKDGHISSFSSNLKELPGAIQDPDTMINFWDRNPEAWEECRKEIQDPRGSITAFVEWVKRLPGKPVCVGYPATFDFMFVYWYIRYFDLESPLSFSAIDMKSYIMAMLKTDYRKIGKRSMPRRWFSSKNKHTHIAVDDAIEQGEMFIKILRENLGVK